MDFPIALTSNRNNDKSPVASSADPFQKEKEFSSASKPRSHPIDLTASSREKNHDCATPRSTTPSLSALSSNYTTPESQKRLSVSGDSPIRTKGLTAQMNGKSPLLNSAKSPGAPRNLTGLNDQNASSPITRTTESAKAPRQKDLLQRDSRIPTNSLGSGNQTATAAGDAERRNLNSDRLPAKSTSTNGVRSPGHSSRPPSQSSPRHKDLHVMRKPSTPKHSPKGPKALNHHSLVATSINGPKMPKPYTSSASRRASSHAPDKNPEDSSVEPGPEYITPAGPPQGPSITDPISVASISVPRVMPNNAPNDKEKVTDVTMVDENFNQASHTATDLKDTTPSIPQNIHAKPNKVSALSLLEFEQRLKHHLANLRIEHRYHVKVIERQSFLKLCTV